MKRSSRAIEKVLEKNASDIEAFFLRGSIPHRPNAKRQKAIEDFRKVLELNPDLVQGHYHLALAYAQAGNAEEARKEFKEVLAISPNFKDAILQLSPSLKLKTGIRLQGIEYAECIFGKIRRSFLWPTFLLGTAYSAENRLERGAMRFL